MFGIQQHHGLIILDGLELVQESAARGGFGRLTSPSLRDLLNHIARGSARELSVLVTSRFPLTDLRDSQPRLFHTIAGGYIKEYCRSDPATPLRSIPVIPKRLAVHVSCHWTSRVRHGNKRPLLGIKLYFQ